MHRYFAYGLGIHSELPLPELVAAEANADVVIRVDRVRRSVPGEAPSSDTFRATPAGASIHYEKVGTFLIRGGAEITVDPDPAADAYQLRLAIVGPVFSILLHQRGRLVLHASAVKINARAIVFLGGAGWGKSTTAALFLARGHALISDDIVSVFFDESASPLIDPAYPLLKVWPEAADSIGEDVRASPRVNPRIEKRAHRVTRAFSIAAVPLGCVYVLGEGARAEIEPLMPKDAFIELVRHTFVVQLLQATESQPAHFRQCSALASGVPVRRLKRPQALTALPAVATLVEEDIARLRQS
jgi:hypothetical protein